MRTVDEETLDLLARSGPELVLATRPFAREDRAQTWRLLLSTLALQALAMVGTALAPLWLKPVGSVLVALLMIRLFIFVHDMEHGAIFRDSPLGRAIVWGISFYTLNAPPVWRENHSRHHRTNSQPLARPLSDYRVGDFVNRTVTVEQWGHMSGRERLLYRVARSPLLVVFAWFVVFAFGACIAPFFRDPRTMWAGPVALFTYAAVATAVGLTLGPAVLVWCLLLPNFLGSMLGVYLFVAQHAFPEAVVVGTEKRADLLAAALHASSFFDMPRWMHWFTGNIGYHHVHHLNHRIPFYRLPEAMEALPELQQPGRVTFSPASIAAVFRSNIWDPEQRRLVSLAEAEAAR